MHYCSNIPVTASRKRNGNAHLSRYQSLMHDALESIVHSQVFTTRNLVRVPPGLSVHSSFSCCSGFKRGTGKVHSVSETPKHASTDDDADSWPSAESSSESVRSSLSAGISLPFGSGGGGAGGTALSISCSTTFDSILLPSLGISGCSLPCTEKSSGGFACMPSIAAMICEYHFKRVSPSTAEIDTGGEFDRGDGCIVIKSPSSPPCMRVKRALLKSRLFDGRAQFNFLDQHKRCSTSDSLKKCVL